MILKNSNRSPMSRERKVRVTIQIQIAKNSATDQAKVFKRLLKHETIAQSHIEAGGRSFGILPRPGTSADKKVKGAVGINVGQSERTGGRLRIEETFARYFPCQINNADGSAI